MKLSGIRVVDLSQFLPGPQLTMTMADHGADVIRVEPPGGEPTRAIGPAQDGVSAYFRNTHRNKRSIVLDLKRPEAVAAFLRLARTADVVVETFRPGVVDRLGIGYAAVRAVNPAVVYCSIAAFGQTGPLARRPAHDLSIEAETGVLGLGVDADGTPVVPGMLAADMAGSLTALSAILMALLRRQQTGEGEYVDISMQDCLASWLAHVVGPVFAERREIDPAEERTQGGSAFYRIYRCRDGRFLTLGGNEPKFVAALLGALGRPDLVALCRLPPGRAQEPVREFLAATFAREPLAHWSEFLAGLDVCWAPVRGVMEALDGEQLTARGMHLVFPGGVRQLGNPIRFAREPGVVRPDAPALGEHTRDVLREAGCTEAEIDVLVAR